MTPLLHPIHRALVRWQQAAHSGGVLTGYALIHEQRRAAAIHDLHPCMNLRTIIARIARLVRITHTPIDRAWDGRKPDEWGV